MLRESFTNIIGVWPLEMLHTKGGFEGVSDKPGGKGSVWHDIFYNKMRGSFFIDFYRLFMRKEIAPLFDEKIVYQKFPTLRIQIPNHKGVSDYHVDTEYNHPVEETNIWLPFTNAYRTASIYIESKPGKKDYEPQNVKYGEYLMFEGGKLAHGNEVNTTGETRIYIDMRVIPLSKFKPSQLKGLAHGKIRDTKGTDAYYGIM